MIYINKNICLFILMLLVLFFNIQNIKFDTTEKFYHNSMTFSNVSTDLKKQHFFKIEYYFVKKEMLLMEKEKVEINSFKPEVLWNEYYYEDCFLHFQNKETITIHLLRRLPSCVLLC